MRDDALALYLDGEPGDAAELAKLVGARLDEVSIEPAMGAFGTMLEPLFNGTDTGTTEENIQARSRGLTLMALSNKQGAMVLSTGNKSEMSVGYATLYGDMCGGYSVLKDVYKTDVFKLSDWRNQVRPPGALGPEGRVIPERIHHQAALGRTQARPDRPGHPAALRALDDILQCLIERERAWPRSRPGAMTGRP